VADAATQLNFKPIYMVDANFYVAPFASWNKSAEADNVYSRQAFVPLEEASSTPAVQQYLDIVHKSGGDVSQLGQQAASSFLLWATAAKTCGSSLTRDCVVKYAQGVHQWTGGGLHAATDPGANLPPQCGLVLKLSGTKWVRYTPQAGFDCSPDFVQPVPATVDVVKRVGITTSDRVVHKFQKS
jgi:hypothetical protein